jgi:Ca-activated chloride channel family protein
MKRSVFNGEATVLISTFSILPAAQEGEEDKTLSPYFYVQCENDQKPDMPLLSTSADVNIAGVIADVTVFQVYKNSGSAPIEAIYVCPASTRAAVYALKMVIGERVIEAEVKERQQARIEYETAKQEGKSDYQSWSEI